MNLNLFWLFRLVNSGYIQFIVLKKFFLEIPHSMLHILCLVPQSGMKPKQMTIGRQILVKDNTYFKIYIWGPQFLVTSIWKKHTEETTKQCILHQCLVEVHSCSFPTLIALLWTVLQKPSVWAKIILTPK